MFLARHPFVLPVQRFSGVLTWRGGEVEGYNVKLTISLQTAHIQAKLEGKICD